MSVTRHSALSAKATSWSKIKRKTSSQIRWFLVMFVIYMNITETYSLLIHEFLNMSPIKRGVNKMPQSFFLVEISPPNNLCAAFVCRLKTVSALLRLFSAAHYSWEMLESLVLWLCLSLFKPRRQLLMKNSKEENWFCGVVRFDIRIWSVSKVSLFKVQKIWFETPWDLLSVVFGLQMLPLLLNLGVVHNHVSYYLEIFILILIYPLKRY